MGWEAFAKNLQKGLGEKSSPQRHRDTEGKERGRKGRVGRGRFLRNEPSWKKSRSWRVEREWLGMVLKGICIRGTKRCEPLQSLAEVVDTPSIAKALLA